MSNGKRHFLRPSARLRVPMGKREEPADYAPRPRCFHRNHHHQRPHLRRLPAPLSGKHNLRSVGPASDKGEIFGSSRLVPIISTQNRLSALILMIYCLFTKKKHVFILIVNISIYGFECPPSVHRSAKCSLRHLRDKQHHFANTTLCGRQPWWT